MNTEVLYRERLWPGFAFPSFLTFMGASLGIAYQRAYHGHVGLLTFGCCVVVTGLATFALAVPVEVTTRELRVGRARISREHLGKIAVLNSSQTKEAMGHGAHASAMNVSRSGIKKSVLVEITDVRDPHPYWLFASRQPEAVAQALHSEPMISKS